ncbi:saccharopine dehydrogenase [Naegleria gruberi]|uniref:Saccharopine dehydrogenase [NAD(+), L-lysine-forming] n=1 Tax=Naegleria gruberi TaxID=5762 RepID=D2V3E3_NAEGR|nr:saccharopine dehydrogenase [Naegleria gruberi]EFC48623.1 saccharopine dehydrogenase [Naegleria gruberi]|eukprot:XP_002681367.1 saccharopine dehydrogenase [Naegleria gruberi strain NEG-M]
MQQVHLWLRDEVKPFEQRTALTPSDAEKLIKEFNFKITVEKSVTRAFDDEEYVKVGCQLVESNSWITQAPKLEENDNFYILGLKELPLGNTQLGDIQVPHLLSQRHIFFAHCFKRQSDWKDTMSRFVQAEPRPGQILDLEFLNLDNGRRVAAFGYAAGFNGMAMGLLTYCKQKLHSNDLEVLNEIVKPFKNRTELVNHIKDLLSKLDHTPKCLVLGALGRCGSGSVKCAELCGIPESHLIKWDLNETKAGGPFPQLSTDVDILVNDIYLSGEIKPFLTMEMAQKGDRRMSVFIDVSCDVTNPFNPFPINNQVTTFDRPVRRVDNTNNLPLDVIAIDHLPTMTPQESSDEFSNALVTYLAELRNVNFSNEQGETEGIRVWLRANQLFEKKVQEFKQEL